MKYDLLVIFIGKVILLNKYILVVSHIINNKILLISKMYRGAIGFFFIYNV